MSDIIIPWEPRECQEKVLEKFIKTISKGKKFLFVDSPVGTGKSLMCMMMAKYFKENIDDSAKFDITTNTKILQDQYLRDFKYAKTIKGMDNYYCSKYRCSCSEGMELEKIKKQKCMPCGYKSAKREYLNSSVGVTNFHMLINYWMYTPDMMQQRNAKVLFVDEAHSFEETYCDFIDAYFSRTYLEDLEIWREEMLEPMKAVKKKKEFAEFIRNFIQPELERRIEGIAKEVQLPFVTDFDKIQLLKEYRRLYRVNCKYNRFLDDEGNWGDNWVIDITENSNGMSWKVEAIWGKKYLNEIWDKYDFVVFLSGTILDKTFFSNLMGVDRDQATYLTIDSPFPIKNRKIIYKPIDRLSYNRKRMAFENMKPEIKTILDKHKDVKGIVHTANYELANWIEDEIKDDTCRLIFHDSHSREVKLQEHYNRNDPTVLISPSMINGVDLKDDLSRFQIILKVPYPNLSSVKVQRRMESSPLWYSWKTMCDIIQSYGRSIRSEEDWAVTYILDENFGRLLQRVKMPSYLTDAIIEIDE